jgi:hypothetical protein
MGKTWLKIGSHVQLKSDVSSDGKIITSHGKGNWTVAWEHSGVQSKHHSKGLKQWTFSAPLSDSSESENEEGSGDEDSDTGVPAPLSVEVHEQRKKDFEKIAKSLEGKTVTVTLLRMLESQFSSLIWIHVSGR